MTDSRGKHCPVCEGCPDPDYCFNCGDQYLDHRTRPDCESETEACTKCKCEDFLDAPVDQLCDYHDEELCVEHGDAYAGGVE